jgi:hypothetical protein
MAEPDRDGSISTKLGCRRDVRFTPDSDRTADITEGPFRANKRLMHRSKRGVADHSEVLITLSCPVNGERVYISLNRLNSCSLCDCRGFVQSQHTAVVMTV